MMIHVCPACAFAVQPEHKFCTHCGAKLDHMKQIPADSIIAPPPETVFQILPPQEPWLAGKQLGTQIDSETLAALRAAPAPGVWAGPPACGAADPFAAFLALTERLLAGGATNEETYETISGTYTNLRSKDPAGQLLLEQGRDCTAQDSLSNAFFLWALHTVYHMF